MDDAAPQFDPPPLFARPALVAKADPPPKFDPPPPPARDYPAAFAAVRAGAAVTLVVGGVTPPPGDHYTATAAEANRPAGVYRCELRGGVPWIEPAAVPTTPAAPEVRPAATFPDTDPVRPVRPTAVRPVGVTAGGAKPVVTGDRSHQCPNCGTGPWAVIAGFNPDGTHRHQCQNCGTVFTH
jgi:hypothetical protein